MPRMATWLPPLGVCALALLLLAALVAVASGPESPPKPMGTRTDREALVVLYNATDGENWTTTHTG